MACDLLNGTETFAGKYTPEEKKRFEAYLQKKLDLIQLPNKDEDFLRQRILTMYANPAINHLKLSHNEEIRRHLIQVFFCTLLLGAMQRR